MVQLPSGPSLLWLWAAFDGISQEIGMTAKKHSKHTKAAAFWYPVKRLSFWQYPTVSTAIVPPFRYKEFAVFYPSGFYHAVGVEYNRGGAIFRYPCKRPALAHIMR
jgi:hypothetical protein